MSHHLDARAAAIIAAGAGDPDDLLTTKQLAAWFGMKPNTLEIWRSVGKGPPFEQLSPRIIRYRRSAVLGWLDERRHASTAEYRGANKQPKPASARKTRPKRPPTYRR